MEILSLDKFQWRPIGSKYPIRFDYALIYIHNAAKAMYKHLNLLSRFDLEFFLCPKIPYTSIFDINFSFKPPRDLKTIILDRQSRKYDFFLPRNRTYNYQL